MRKRPCLRSPSEGWIGHRHVAVELGNWESLTLKRRDSAWNVLVYCDLTCEPSSGAFTGSSAKSLQLPRSGRFIILYIEWDMLMNIRRWIFRAGVLTLCHFHTLDIFRSLKTCNLFANILKIYGVMQVQERNGPQSDVSFLYRWRFRK
jgi:hypothetical protein